MSWLGSVAVACLDTPEITLQPPVEVIGLSPTIDVPEDAAVTLAFSGPVALGEDPFAVRDGDREVPAKLTTAETVLSIAPAPRWPAGATLELVPHALRDEMGRPIEIEAPLRFSVRAREIAPLPAVVRTPTPGMQAPLNLAWVAVALGEEELEAEASLVAEEQRIELVRERALEGVVLFRAPTYQGECRPFCPATHYQLSVAGWERAPGLLGEVETGTVADERPPEIIAVKVVFRAGQPWVEICADEPILVRGEATSGAGATVPYASAPVAVERVLARPSAPLDSATPHDLRFEVEDLAGNRGRTIEVPLVTPPEIAIAISEIVASPLRDWNDSEGGSVPFDPIPGVGTVSEADEWVELVNLSEAPLDLEAAGIELHTVDGTPSVTALAGAPGLYFGDGGSITAWWPGEALVVRARGAMSSQTLVVEVAAGAQIFDRVVIGEQSGADHAGGSPTNVYFESIARTESGGFAWCAATPGDPLPARECDAD